MNETVGMRGRVEAGDGVDDGGGEAGDEVKLLGGDEEGGAAGGEVADPHLGAPHLVLDLAELLVGGGEGEEAAGGDAGGVGAEEERAHLLDEGGGQGGGGGGGKVKVAEHVAQLRGHVDQRVHQHHVGRLLHLGRENLQLVEQSSRQLARLLLA